jgi:hypothetical protein
MSRDMMTQARRASNAVLRINGDHKPGSVRTAVLDEHVRRGWHRITFVLAVSTDNVERGDRILWAIESEDGRTLTITESGGSCSPIP